MSYIIQEKRNNITENTNKLDASISINIYYSFDEENGYFIDYDSIKQEFEEKLDEVLGDIQHLNHERNDHLRTKHGEGL